MRKVFVITLAFCCVSAGSPSAAQPLMADPDWTGESDQMEARFGESVASAGDVNADGYDDVIVGAYHYGEDSRGRAFLYLGSAAGLQQIPVWTGDGGHAGARFGESVASAGDVNADGYDDVIVGASAYTNGEANEGRAYLFLGSADGLELTPAWHVESDQADARLGESVASAGDVNADGYDDVIIGAWLYDNGKTDAGRAYLYLGSADGLEAAPAWTAEGDQEGADFGISVASAGDVNGDGHDDVIIGAWTYSHGEMEDGRVYLYLGSDDGLEPNPAWNAESDQPYSDFGYSVASAGDVNGDGYDDVIVGASAYTNGEFHEGGAYLYLGSAGGLEAIPAWTAESNHVDAVFGISVASAGDVNVDGYDDVIIGAAYYDNPETDEGRVFLYLGTEGGLTAAPAWTAEIDQGNAAFGISVASAGDVDADGYVDAIVGAWWYSNGQPLEGGAFVYHGVACGYFQDRSVYGRLLFPPRCTQEATALAEDVYDSRTVGIDKGDDDTFYLSSDGMTFAPLVVDDAIHIEGQDSGFGPYAYREGYDPEADLPSNIPIEVILVPQIADDMDPAPELIPFGSNPVLFELLDTDRLIYGNTALYLIRDCGVYMEKGPDTTLHWVSYAVEIDSMQSNLDVVSGNLSDLRADEGFSNACLLHPFGLYDTTQAVDDRQDPPAGDGYYYLISGTCGQPIGYGESSLVPDARDALPPGVACSVP